MDTEEDTDAAMTMDEICNWEASRKAAAATIEIETCEINWWWAYGCDPYGLREAQGKLPEEMRQVGRYYFVRTPESDGWVHEHDLSPAQHEAMYARIERGDTEWDNYWPF